MRYTYTKTLVKILVQEGPGLGSISHKIFLRIETVRDLKLKTKGLRYTVTLFMTSRRVDEEGVIIYRRPDFLLVYIRVKSLQTKEGIETDYKD